MNYSDRLTQYFDRPIANEAAKSLKDGVEIQLMIDGDPFLFRRESGQNRIQEGKATDPHLTFRMTPKAAESILDYQIDDIGETGVHIAKLIVSNDPNVKVEAKIHTGVMTLLSKGYFGVITTGGKAFGSFLASRGLGSMGAIKNAIKNLKS